MERHNTHPSTIFSSALREFYCASNYGCNGDIANLNDVFQTIQAGESKLSLHAAKRGNVQETVAPCLRSMEQWAAILDQMVIFANMKLKPSEFVWGCLRYIFLVRLSKVRANLKYIYLNIAQLACKSDIHSDSVAEMFYSIGKIWTGLSGPGQLEHLTLQHSMAVRNDIVLLYVQIIRCCGDAIGAMVRKRERLRGSVSGVSGTFLPAFRIKYEANLGGFRNVQGRVTGQIANLQRDRRAKMTKSMESKTSKQRDNSRAFQSSKWAHFNTQKDISGQFGVLRSPSEGKEKGGHKDGI